MVIAPTKLHRIVGDYHPRTSLGEGTLELASEVVKVIEQREEQFAPLYPDMPLYDKINKVATEIYGTSSISVDVKVKNQLKEWQDAGFGALPVCIAKTQYSFSTDPKAMGAPSGHVIPVREVRFKLQSRDFFEI